MNTSTLYKHIFINTIQQPNKYLNLLDKLFHSYLRVSFKFRYFLSC